MAASAATLMPAARLRLLDETLRSKRRPLLDFIRRRIPTVEDAEDIVQEVYADLATSFEMDQVVESLSGWLYQVARFKIADFFRRRRPVVSLDAASAPATGEGAPRPWAQLLPDSAAGPDAEFARQVLLEELLDALEELPPAQRWVFWENEVEGRTFRELAIEAGVPLNTLLSRKRYALLHLRRRLREIYDELNPS